MILGYLMHCRGNSCSQVGRMLLSGVDNCSMSSSLLPLSCAVFCFHHCPLADLSFIMLTANSIIHEPLNESLLLSHPSCCQCESHRSSYQITHVQNYPTGLCLQNLLTARHFIILFSCVTFIWRVLWRYLETSTLVMWIFLNNLWVVEGQKQVLQLLLRASQMVCAGHGKWWSRSAHLNYWIFLLGWIAKSALWFTAFHNGALEKKLQRKYCHVVLHFGSGALEK